MSIVQKDELLEFRCNCGRVSTVAFDVKDEPFSREFLEQHHRPRSCDCGHPYLSIKWSKRGSG